VQVADGGQGSPQVPQLAGSPWRSVQIPLQLSTSQALHPVAASQVAPAEHMLPHCRQFAGSLVTSMQPLPQFIWPAGHSQLPATQLSLGSQVTPQSPQFASSSSVLTHVPLQSTSGAVQPPDESGAGGASTMGAPSGPGGGPSSSPHAPTVKRIATRPSPQCLRMCTS
jgi:hypothetical protein